VFQQKGYTPPKKWDEYIALAQKMKTDGLNPIGFGDKDGWPAMGTFDYINMRANGYQFHVDLMAGKESWTDPKVKNVFKLWASTMPYHEGGALGRTWEETAQNLQKKTTGMVVFGMPHPGTQFPENEHDDIGFFAFPEIDSANGQDSVEAPIDGWMIAKKAKNLNGARDLAKFIATPEAETAYLKSDPNNIAVNSGADKSGYSQLQKDGAALVATAKHVSQFLDRDTRPDFAQTVMIPAIQSFINAHSDSDIDTLCKSIEDQKKSIFANPIS
jgi:multiple sugar transport system substrate-binding protein